MQRKTCFKPHSIISTVANVAGAKIQAALYDNKSALEPSKLKLCHFVILNPDFKP